MAAEKKSTALKGSWDGSEESSLGTKHGWCTRGGAAVALRLGFWAFGLGLVWVWVIFKIGFNFINWAGRIWACTLITGDSTKQFNITLQTDVSLCRNLLFKRDSC